MKGYKLKLVGLSLAFAIGGVFGAGVRSAIPKPPSDHYLDMTKDSNAAEVWSLCAWWPTDPARNGGHKATDMEACQMADRVFNNEAIEDSKR